MIDLMAEQTKALSDVRAWRAFYAPEPLGSKLDIVFAALDAERARADNTDKFLSKTQDRVEVLESLNLRALVRNRNLEAVAEAAKWASNELRHYPLNQFAFDRLQDLRAALVMLEEPQPQLRGPLAETPDGVLNDFSDHPDYPNVP